MGSPACPVERAFKELNILVNTNSKEIIEKNKRHIIKQMGGKTVFFNEVSNYMKYQRGMTPYRAIYEMAQGGDFLIYNEDIRKYLHRLGLKDDEKLDKFRSPRGYGMAELYWSLMARDGERLFKDIEKEKAKKSR